jgi:hypothetical protein
MLWGNHCHRCYSCINTHTKPANNAVNASCRSRGFEIETLLAATALPQAFYG